MKQPCVYILASQRKGTLYTDVTSDLIARVWQHKQGFVEGFTKTHNIYLS
jgi:putative endonuclease